MIGEFYYWMYRGLRKIRKEEDPAFDAFLGVLFLIGLNLTVILRILNNLKDYVVDKDALIFYALSFAFSSLIIGYFGLYKRRLQIFQKVNLKSKYSLKRHKIYFIIYVLISFITFYSVLVFT